MTMINYNDIKVGDIVVTSVCDSGDVMVGYVVSKEEITCAGKVVRVKFGFEKKPYTIWVEDYLADESHSVHNSHDIIRVVGNIIPEAAEQYQEFYYVPFPECQQYQELEDFEMVSVPTDDSAFFIVKDWLDSINNGSYYQKQ